MMRFAGRRRSSASEEGLAGGSLLLREAEHACEHRMGNARRYLGHMLIYLHY